MPIWKATDTLYLPATINNADSHLSTNGKLVITYNTITHEKFRYSFLRNRNGKYKERLKKDISVLFGLPKSFIRRAHFIHLLM